MATIGVTRGLGDHDLKVHDSNIYIKPFLSCCPEVGLLHVLHVIVVVVVVESTNFVLHRSCFILRMHTLLIMIRGAIIQSLYL